MDCAQPEAGHQIEDAFSHSLALEIRVGRLTALLDTQGGAAAPVKAHGDLEEWAGMSGSGPARVKTCASQESVEPFSLLPSSDSRRQHFGF